MVRPINPRFSQRQIVVNYPSASDVAQYAASTLFLPGHRQSTLKWNSAVKEIVLNREFYRLVEEQSVVYPLSFHILSCLDGSLTRRGHSARAAVPRGQPSVSSRRVQHRLLEEVFCGGDTAEHDDEEPLSAL